MRAVLVGKANRQTADTPVSRSSIVVDTYTWHCLHLDSSSRLSARGKLEDATALEGGAREEEVGTRLEDRRLHRHNIAGS